MPKFENQKIRILFYLSLSETNAELNRNGFKKLSEAVNNDPNTDGSLISQRYIDERIFQQLRESSDEISLKSEYVDQLAIYLGYENFFAFEKHFDRIKKFIEYSGISNDVDQETITVIYDKSAKSFMESKCNQALYLNQENSFHYEAIDYKKLEIAKLENELSTSIIFLDPAFLADKTDLISQIDNLLKEGSSLIPVYVAGDNSNPLNKNRPSWLELDDVEMLVQYLLTRTSENIQDQISKNTNQKPSINNIHDSGAVNLGKIGKIQAEYISSRDMHITINKDKSKDN